jgi:flagella basal body P-ring formation protein FlgA
MKAKLFLISCIIIVTNLVNAQNTFKHKRITVFKDGTAFIEKELTAPTKNKTIHFDQLPIGLTKTISPNVLAYNSDQERITLGTLRFTAIDNEITESTVNWKYSDSLYRDYFSLSEFLKMNVGKKIKVNSMLSQKQLTYKIINVVDNTLLVQADNNVGFIPIPSISNIEFIDNPETKVKLNDQERKASLSLDLNLLNNSKNQQINLSYLQRGITWLPAYFIDINEQKKGKLILEANLINDIEDIENAEINFAVGVPAFSFKSIHEPMVSGKSVWEFLSQLNNQQLQEYSNNIQMNMMSQRNVYREEASDQNYDAFQEGNGSEDLYFYNKQNISLNKNGRIKSQLLNFDFDYEDVYSCDLEQNMTNSYDSKTKSNQVWHSIRFKNTSNQPLTTGTVFFRKDDKNLLKLISQNQLDYAPKNEFVTAKMTIAPDILVSNKDVEIDRKPVDGDYLLNIEGEISIVNYKNIDIDIYIKRNIFGTMLNSDLTWTVTSNLDYYNAKNTSNLVKWKLKIPAGKTATIKYKYKILVD